MDLSSNNLLMDLFLILILILINGFLAGSEIAIISVKRSKLNSLAETSRKTGQINDLFLT